MGSCVPELPAITRYRQFSGGGRNMIENKAQLLADLAYREENGLWPEEFWLEG